MSILYLFDTNLLVHMVRRGAAGDRLRERYRPLTAEPRPMISVVSIGELRSLAIQFGWGGAKLLDVEFLLGYFQAVRIDDPLVLEKYAMIDAKAAMEGRTLGKNDAWIAATATATGAILLTTDRDFDRIGVQGFAHERIDLDGTRAG